MTDLTKAVDAEAMPLVEKRLRVTTRAALKLAQEAK